MKFEQDFIDKVRDASNIIDVISQHLELKKSGSGYLGLCPFHGEKTASFSVSEDKQVYHCFGCKASGDVFRFVQEYQGLTFPETVEYLAKRAGIPIAASSYKRRRARSRKSTLFRINEFASQFFQNELAATERRSPGVAVLKKRGLTREFAKKHRIGYCAR